MSRVERIERRADSRGELRDSDESGANFQRPAQQELPDKQEGHEPTPFGAAIALEQVEIASPRAGQGCTKLAPDQAIAEHDPARDQPAQNHVGPWELSKHEGHR